MNNKKVNQTRKQRGYAFENHIVGSFNELPGWTAKRLGSPSVQLPDVIGINNEQKRVIAIEAKSTVQNYAYVPQDQIERCIAWVEQFELYELKQVILAFKFGQTIVNCKWSPKHRSLKYHYRIFPYAKVSPADVRMDYEGNILVKDGNEWASTKMEVLKT